MTTGKEEQPLFTISPSLGFYLSGMIILFLIILPLFLFCVTLPVLTSGSYESVFSFTEQPSSKKIKIFYLSLVYYICLPTLIPQFRVGNYIFHENRLEVKSYIFRKKYILPYEKIHTRILQNRRIVISDSYIPEWSENPIKRLINEYLKGFIIVLFPFYYEDSSNLSKAIELLKQKSVTFCMN